MIPDRYRLAAVGVLVAGALLAAACAGAWLNGLRWQARLAVAERVHADTLAEIGRAAATQLATQQAAQQRLTQALAAVDTQHYQELTHAQQTIDRLSADLAGAHRRLSVRLAAPACAGGLPGNADPARLDDGAGARADLHPATAAGVVRVTGRADQCRARLTALQAWVRTATAKP